MINFREFLDEAKKTSNIRYTIDDFAINGNFNGSGRFVSQTDLINPYGNKFISDALFYLYNQCNMNFLSCIFGGVKTYGDGSLRVGLVVKPFKGTLQDGTKCNGESYDVVCVSLDPRAKVKLNKDIAKNLDIDISELDPVDVLYEDKYLDFKLILKVSAFNKDGDEIFVTKKDIESTRTIGKGNNSYIPASYISVQDNSGIS